MSLISFGCLKRADSMGCRWTSLPELFCRVEIGIGPRVALGLIGEPPVFQRPAIPGIPADGIVEIRQCVDVVVFLEVGKTTFGIIVRDGAVVSKLLAASCRGCLGCRPELDRLAAVGYRGIVILLEIEDDATIVKCVGVLLVDLRCLAVVGEREIVFLLQSALDAAIKILAREVATLVAARLDDARAWVDRGIAGFLGAEPGVIACRADFKGPAQKK